MTWVNRHVAKIDRLCLAMSHLSYSLLIWCYSLRRASINLFNFLSTQQSLYCTEFSHVCIACKDVKMLVRKNILFSAKSLRQTWSHWKCLLGFRLNRWRFITELSFGPCKSSSTWHLGSYWLCPDKTRCTLDKISRQTTLGIPINFRCQTDPFVYPY